MSPLAFYLFSDAIINRKYSICVSKVVIALFGGVFTWRPARFVTRHMGVKDARVLGVLELA